MYCSGRTTYGSSERIFIFPTTGPRIAIYQLDLVLWLLVAARYYRPPSGAGLRGPVVGSLGCSFHTWRYVVRIRGRMRKYVVLCKMTSLT